MSATTEPRDSPWARAIPQQARLELFGDRKHEVREQDFIIVREGWNKYVIKETGEEVRIKDRF